MQFIRRHAVWEFYYFNMAPFTPHHHCTTSKRIPNPNDKFLSLLFSLIPLLKHHHSVFYRCQVVPKDSLFIYVLLRDRFGIQIIMLSKQKMTEESSYLVAPFKSGQEACGHSHLPNLIFFCPRFDILIQSTPNYELDWYICSFFVQRISLPKIPPPQLNLRNDEINPSSIYCRVDIYVSTTLTITKQPAHFNVLK